MEPLERKKSLEQLAQEGCDVDFDGPQEREEGDYLSGLVHRCESLYGKPIGEYSPGDLRVMIGQDIALPFLVPLALNVLSRDPMVVGDYFPGDLLRAVLRCGHTWTQTRFWQEHTPLLAQLEEILQRPRNHPEVKELVEMDWAGRNLTAKMPAPVPKPRRKRKGKS